MQLRPSYPVVTERLRLRPLTRADIPALLVYRGDPEVCRYLPFEPMTTEVLEGRLDGALGATDLLAEGGALTLGAERADTGELIGDVILFHRSEANRHAELGYVFSPAVAGRGYATEACRAVLGLAFGDLGAHRVTALLDARNTASARLAERLGMRREAHHVRDDWFKGEWSDTLVYALLDDEWAARPTTTAAGPS